MSHKSLWITQIYVLFGRGPPEEVYNLQLTINRLLFRVNSLQLISREFDDKLQIYSDFLGGFEEKA